MKSVLTWCFVSLLACSLVAQTIPKKKASSKPVKPAVTQEDVQSLRDALAAQQQQLEGLKQQLEQTNQSLTQSQQQLQQAQAAAAEAQQKYATVEGETTDQKASIAKVTSDLEDVRTTLTGNAFQAQEDQKRVGALEGLLGRFRLSGDIRVRGEDFFQDKTADRNRARIRVRFGFDGKLNEDFVGGLSIATGTLGDPTSTNTSFTNNFDKKTIGLDRAYLTYNPVAHKWLSLTGGKFAYTWQRTPVTFDSDLNPEGFSEKLNFDLPRVAVIKNVSLTAMQLMYNEVSGNGGVYKGHDSYAVGGQIAGRLQILPFWTATPSFTILNWRYADAILNSNAFAVSAPNAGILGNPTVDPAVPNVGPIPVPGEGPGCSNPGSTGLPSFPTANGCAFGPNGITNSVWVDYTSPTKPVAHFLSSFLYADFILNNQFKTKWARLPINLTLEYLDNLNASDHPFDFTVKSTAGTVDTPGTTTQPDTIPFLGKQSNAYFADFSVGQQKNKGDIQVGYAFLRQEQDSVIASFDESDQRAPTNVLQHRFYALYKLRANTVASFTWWHGRTLNPNLQNAVLGGGIKPGTGAVDPWLNRFQIDLIYSF
ncbi:MAG TPA: putative porin [Terriglobales bacterium]|jgi:Putative porin|nr:putative porin [Terriglobales bacterium]